MSGNRKEDGGIFFDPSDKELIEHYLDHKLKGIKGANDIIVDKDVYAKAPWLLDHNNHPLFMTDVWYYFTTRTQISEKKIGRGKNSKRRITGGDNDGCGSWKPNTTEDIIDKETRKIIGTKKTLTFTKSKKTKKQQKTGEGTSCAIVPGSDSSWIMTEYMLPEEANKFQELVLCKIHKVPKINRSKKKDDRHRPREEGDGGVFFDPSDKELLEHYLKRKLKGKSKTREKDIIVDKDVYAKEPWLLDHNNNPLFMTDVWYYFTTRTQISEKKIGRGKNSKRRITGDNDGGGSWKPNATENIIDKETRKIIGTKKTLTFTKSKNKKKKQKTGDGTSCAIVPGSDSSWIMTEYMLPEDKNKFQQLVLCKIHMINKFENMDDHHEPSEEGNMAHQVDAHATTGTVPERPLEKDAQAGATSKFTEDWFFYVMKQPTIEDWMLA
ncbi:NAC domain-containing protein 105 [Eutrema salsugineum]|nr:NAC domain-containing protein 105 [Eutrema salsugineum]